MALVDYCDRCGHHFIWHRSNTDECRMAIHAPKKKEERCSCHVFVPGRV